MMLRRRWPEADARRVVVAGGVGPAMRDRVGHRREHGRIDGMVRRRN